MPECLGNYLIDMDIIYDEDYCQIALENPDSDIKEMILQIDEKYSVIVTIPEDDVWEGTIRIYKEDEDVTSMILKPIDNTEIRPTTINLFHVLDATFRYIKQQAV